MSLNKKIGILTFHWSDNYGAVLQAYALQSYVNNLGIDSEIINYLPPRKSLAKRLISRSPGKQIEKIYLYKKYILFQKFRRDYLNLSKESPRSINDLKNGMLSQYSDVIVGSDQVWNPSFHSSVKDFFEVYMLNHSDNRNTIAYAPSIGHVTKASIPNEYQLLMTKYISNINSISVRENSSINLLKSLKVEKQVTHVCDPTILLETKNFNFRESVSLPPRFLFSYILHSADKQFLHINQSISSFLNCKIINCNSKSSLASNYVLPSPPKWLSLIQYADFVTTNSFHGVVFSIKYKTPFLAVKRADKQSSMNTRIESLLSLLGLSNRIISHEQQIDMDLIESEIDWDFVHSKIEMFRDSSSSFLLKSLGI